MLETWRRRRDRTLTPAAYEESGGVRGAVAASAGQVYGELTPEQAGTARRILLRLTRVGSLVSRGEARTTSARPVMGPADR
ncbi:hypothetical protein ABZ960_35755 [Streptomyces pseudovenezuelae]|uniref:nSTAND1 domain-containing NTPase n=1 Tax=Streptomyces pseudovenezuelae TaxID=67350 RepID=UPI0034A33671